MENARTQGGQVRSPGYSSAARRHEDGVQEILLETAVEREEPLLGDWDIIASAAGSGEDIYDASASTFAIVADENNS